MKRNRRRGSQKVVRVQLTIRKGDSEAAVEFYTPEVKAYSFSVFHISA